jgi:hypothetical protein
MKKTGQRTSRKSDRFMFQCSLIVVVAVVAFTSFAVEATPIQHPDADLVSTL